MGGKIKVIASESAGNSSWGIGYVDDSPVVWTSEYYNEKGQANYITATEGDMFIDNGGQGFTLNGIWIGEGCEDRISKYPDKNDQIAELIL